MPKKIKLVKIKKKSWEIITKNKKKIYSEKNFYKKDKKAKIDFNLGYNTAPQLSPDNKMICWKSMERDEYESDITKLCIFNFETKEKYYITEEFDTFISGYCWGKDNKTIYFTAVKYNLLYKLRNFVQILIAIYMLFFIFFYLMYRIKKEY